MLARDLSLTDVGLVFACFGLFMMAFELPTGGLSDVFGRRPVIVAAGITHIISCLVFFAVESSAGFIGAVALLAMSRALDSGPLEAWFVDASHEVDPSADVTPGLSLQNSAGSLSLALGAVVGGVLPVIVGDGGASALVVPFLVAAALDVVYLTAVVLVVHSPPTSTEGELRSLLSTGAVEVVRTLRVTGQQVARDAPLRLIVLLAAMAGAVLAGLELLGPERFSDLAGGESRGAAVFGVVLASAFAFAAAGSALSPRLQRLTGRTGVACAAAMGVGVVGLAIVAGVELIVPAALGFGLYYAAHGAAWPLWAAVMHSRVRSEIRATTISGVSFALSAGGLVGNLGIAWIVSISNPSVGFVALAGVAVMCGLVSLALPEAVAREAAQDETVRQDTGSGTPIGNDP